MDHAGFVSYDFNTVYIPRWLHGYINGLIALSSLDSSFSESVRRVATTFEQLGHIQLGTSGRLWQHVVSRGIADTIVSGSWEIMPGSPHPRNLSGCPYLASFELQKLLRRDLCNPTDIRSIRHICPVTCGCGSMEDCPYVCSVPS